MAEIGNAKTPCFRVEADARTGKANACWLNLYHNGSMPDRHLIRTCSPGDFTRFYRRICRGRAILRVFPRRMPRSADVPASVSAGYNPPSFAGRANRSLANRVQRPTLVRHTNFAPPEKRSCLLAPSSAAN